MSKYQCVNCMQVHDVPDAVMRSGNYQCYCGCSTFNLTINGNSYDFRNWKKKHERASVKKDKDEFYGIL